MKGLENFPEKVNQYIKEKKLDLLKEYLQDLSEAELVEGLKLLDQPQQTMVFRLLPKDMAVEIFDMMEPSWQHDLIESFTSDEMISLLNYLEPDDLVHLLDEFPARVAKRLLGQLPQEKREYADFLMGYEDDTVGRIMSPIYVDVKKSMPVHEALKRIRSRYRTKHRDIHSVYVTDDARKLEGMLSLSDLVTASPDEKIENLIKSQECNYVFTNDDQEDAARLVQELDVVELPVLDKERRLVGVLSVDDAMDVLREEVTDDMFDKVGLLDLRQRESDRSHKLLKGSFWYVFAVRVPFLIVTLIGGLLAGAVIDAFEDVLEAVVATAIFIPVIMDMGGNVGTQSSTIFTRGVVLGQINLRRFLYHWGREVLYGFGMAVALGILGGIVAAFWQGIPELGLAVGVSLTLTITVGIALGFLIPFVLVKFGFDQAAGADPIITTLKDITALAIYFTSVSLFLPQVIAAA